MTADDANAPRDLASRVLAAIEEAEQRFTVPLETLREDLVGQATAWIAAFTIPERARVIAERIADAVMPADATHIVADREAILRRCATDRRMVEYVLSWKHDYNDADTYYSCSQSVVPEDSRFDDDQGKPGGGCTDEDRSGQSCDCGVETRRNFFLQRLAEGYGITAEQER